MSARSYSPFGSEFVGDEVRLLHVSRGAVDLSDMQARDATLKAGFGTRYIGRATGSPIGTGRHRGSRWELLLVAARSAGGDVAYVPCVVSDGKVTRVGHEFAALDSCEAHKNARELADAIVRGEYDPRVRGQRAKSRKGVEELADAVLELAEALAPEPGVDHDAAAARCRHLEGELHPTDVLLVAVLARRVGELLRTR